MDYLRIPGFLEMLDERLSDVEDEILEAGPLLPHPNTILQHKCACAVQTLEEVKPDFYQDCIATLGSHQVLLALRFGEVEWHSTLAPLESTAAELSLTPWGLYSILTAFRRDRQTWHDQYRWFVGLGESEIEELIVESGLLTECVRVALDTYSDDAVKALEYILRAHRRWNNVVAAFEARVVQAATDELPRKRGRPAEIEAPGGQRDVANLVQAVCLRRGNDDYELLGIKPGARKDRVEIAKDGFRSSVSRGKKIIESYSRRLWEEMWEDARRPNPTPKAPATFLGKTEVS